MTAMAPKTIMTVCVNFLTLTLTVHVFIAILDSGLRLFDSCPLFPSSFFLVFVNISPVKRASDRPTDRLWSHSTPRANSHVRARTFTAERRWCEYNNNWSYPGTWRRGKRWRRRRSPVVIVSTDQRCLLRQEAGLRWLAAFLAGDGWLHRTVLLLVYPSIGLFALSQFAPQFTTFAGSFRVVQISLFPCGTRPKTVLFYQ